MEHLLRDLRFGYRNLLRNPGFAAAAVVSLAIGIGANTAIFSFVNTILLKPLPVEDPQSLVLFGDGRGRGINTGPPTGAATLFAWPEYNEFRNQTSVFQDIVAIDSTTPRLYASFAHTSDGTREEVQSALVSGNFFAMLGVQPAAGRFFDVSADTTRGAAAWAVLSDAFWARRFHRDPSVVGSLLRMADRDYTIVGVAAKGFFGTRLGEVPDMWFPLTMKPTLPGLGVIGFEQPYSRFTHLVGRLKPGVTLQQANANVNVAYKAMLARYVTSPGPDGRLPDAEDLALMRKAYVSMTSASQGLSQLRIRYADALRMLMSIVALVLLIACANVANLLVAMGAKRQREMAVRLAIGAGRRRVVTQVVTEGILLSAAAGVLGVLVATGAGRLLVHLISTGPRTLPLSFDLDPRVLAFTILISAGTGILFSLAPAIRASRVDLTISLKEGKGAMAPPGRVTFGRVLVVAQVALSLTLLVCGGLLVRSFRNLASTATGFSAENVLVFKMDSDSSGYRQDEKLARLYERIADRLPKLPGVRAAAISQRSFNEGRWIEGFSTPGINLPQSERIIRQFNVVSQGYFETLRMPLLAGRGFSAKDLPGTPYVAVVSATFAREVFGNNDPIGRILKMAPIDKEHDYQIVGVVHDVKSVDVRDTAEKQLYVPLSQNVVFAGNIAVRVSADQGQAASAVRAALTNLEPNLPIRWTTTLAGEVNDSLVREKAVAELATLFAFTALLLSAIGLFGTISFAVARRTNEIGIRIALGAERSGVLAMILRDTGSLLLAGIAIGLPLALASGRLIQSLLYGVGGFDPMTLAVAALVLAAAAGIAGYIPAQRAAAMNPTTALRCE
ncbi:MAG: permease [Bryobacterales bacterium]|nr:permease [Bryobacterales bacterium]